MSSSTSSSAAVRTFALRKRTILSSLTALAFVLVVLPATAFADTTWTGTNSTDWNDDGNWTDAQPDAADVAIINNTSTNNPEVSSAGEVAAAVQLSGDKQLTVSAGDLRVTGQITAPAGTNVNITGGALEFGTILVDNAAGFTMAGGTITGTLAATSGTTLVNNGTNYGVDPDDDVSLGTNVNVNQTANITMNDGADLFIDSRLYTLSGTSIAQAGPAPATIDIDAGGRFLHTGATGGDVNPQIDNAGVIEDDGGAAELDFIANLVAVNANSLGGTLRTSGGGTIRLDFDGIAGGGDSWTLKVGGVTIDNPGGTIAYTGNSPFDRFILNGQTVSLVNGNFTHAGDGEIQGTGTIDSVPPNGGEFLIDSADFSQGADVTIPSDTTARVVGNSAWTNTFNLNINGTLLLADTIVTAPDAAETPQVNISSTGLLTHTGSGTGLFEPRIVSNGGTIQDDSSGELRIQRFPAQVNLYSGTVRTTNGLADVELGTEVHRLQGATTFDTSQGGEIRTIGSADLQLNGQTLTLVGPDALLHESGTISGTGTINGPGTLRVQGGDFAGGGTMNVNAPTVQTSPSNVGGFGSELRIGGDWLANGDLTSTDTATVRVVSGGVLRHSSGTNTVSAPLTIDNGATVSADGGQLQLTDLSNYSGTTLTGGSYDIAGSSSLCIDGALETLAADLQISSDGELLYAPAGCATNAITNELATIAPAGTFTLANGHTANIDTPLQVNGELGGNGTIIGDVNNNGVVSPGLSIGQLNVDGNYSQTAFGSLEIEVTGTGAGQFDVLEVDGAITLNGELAMQPINNFPANAEGGDRVAFLRYTGSRSGTFSDVTTNPSLDLGQPFFDDYDDPGQRVFAVVGNTFKPGGFIARRNRNNGTATLIVKVTGSGTVTVSGPEIKTKSRDADGPGKVNLPIKTRKGTEARRELRRDGRTVVKVKVRYVPDIGNPSKRKIKVELIDRD